MDRNGICKKGKDKNRKHQMTMKKDGAGRIFWSCDRCGFAEVIFKRALKAIDFIS